MKNSVGKGAIILIVSGFVCKLFGAMFRLPLTNILGMEGIGVFQMVMSLYSLTLVLITGGVTTALSQLVSSSRARGEFGKVGCYLRRALALTLGAGLILGVSFLLFARSIASAQGAPAAFEAYRLLIFLLPLGAIVGVFRGIIQGYENMTPTAISQIIEQVVKFSFGLLFAFYLGKNGIASGVYGAFLGITISEVLAAGYLTFYMFARTKISYTPYQNATKDFLLASLPLALSGAVIPLTHAIDSMIIISRMSMAGIARDSATSLYGLQSGVVGAILNFPLIISLSVAMALLPKISYLSSKQDTQAQQRIISNSFSIMWFFLLPLVVGLMAVSRALYPLIYPVAIKGFLDEALELTIIGGISVVLSAIMQFLLSLLQAKGYFGFTLFATALGGLAKILIVFFTARIPSINIFAIPISNMVLAMLVCILALLKLGMIVKVSGYELLTPLLASFVMFMVIFVFIKTVELPLLAMLFLSVVIGGAIYFTLNIPIVSGLFKRIFGKNQFREEKNEQNGVN